MSFVSNKFKILNQLRQEPNFKEWIPPFLFINLDSEIQIDPKIFEKSECFILRSSIKGESGTQLNSGKSISIKDIRSPQDFESAFAKIRAQEKLQQIILQQQFPAEVHYTAFISKAFCYCEESFTLEPHRGIWTSEYESSNIRHDVQFESLVTAVRQIFKDDLIIEWGVSKEKIGIFQINQIQNSEIRKYTESRVLQFLYDDFNSWKSKKNLMDLVREEFQAYKFRELFKMTLPSEYTIEHIFKNWKCLMHYYYLHCLFQKEAVNSESWAHYLSNVGKAGFLEESSKRHIQIANELSVGLNCPAPTKFIEEKSGPVFLGTGSFVLKVSEIEFVETLEADLVYRNQAQKIIICSDSKLISHGFLAAAETITKVVANLDHNSWTILKSAERVRIDFRMKTINAE